MSLAQQQQDWEILGQIDPLSAIIHDSCRKFGTSDTLHRFFLTGEQEIEQVMTFAHQIGYPAQQNTALDFGCGIGRLTRALAKYFRLCYGVDISESMIRQAWALNQEWPNCQFVVNNREHLQIFKDNYFDLVYSNLVLQHLPHRSLIQSYIAEFVRVVRENGLVVFQLPSHIPLRQQLQLRRRLYVTLQKLGFSPRFLYERLHLNPIRMNFIPEDEVIAFLETLGVTVLEVLADAYGGRFVQSRTYYVTKPGR